MADIFHLAPEVFTSYIDPSEKVGGSSQVEKKTPHSSQTSSVYRRDNDFVASEERAAPPPDQHFTYYRQDAAFSNGMRDGIRRTPRRIQSLPARKNKEFGYKVKAKPNSATTRKRDRGVAPLPQLNNLMHKLRASERDNTYRHYKSKDHAGLSTIAQEEHNHRSQKFASSWANARVDQAKLRSINDDIHEARPTENKTTNSQHEDKVARPDHHDHGPSTKEREETKKRNEHVLEHLFNDDHDKTNVTSTRIPPPHRKQGLFINLRESEGHRERKKWDSRILLEKPSNVKVKEIDELTHHPMLTDTNEVYKAYTGVTKRELRKSDQSVSRAGSQFGQVYQATISVSPRNKKEYVLTLREADMYRKISSVYGEDEKKKRKSLLLKKLMTIEIEQVKTRSQNQRDKEKQRTEARRRQQQQLHFVRNRFEEEQVRRFRSQYVTGRVLEHEKQTRGIYGLPDDNDDESEVQGSDSQQSHRKSAPKHLNSKKKKKVLEKKYSKLFDVKVGPSWNPRETTPKMEGIDVVTVDVKSKEGKTKEKKMEVKDIVKEARNLLQVSSHEPDLSIGGSRGVTPFGRSTRQSRRRPSLDSIDLEDDDDDDIFEKARRKYNLDVDSTY